MLKKFKGVFVLPHTFANIKKFWFGANSNPRTPAFHIFSEIRVNLYAEWQLEVTDLEELLVELFWLDLVFRKKTK